MAHAREEYLFQYSIYVLESCTSRRLTYFIPPTNLIPLLFVRPLRLFLPSESVRQIRIILLRAVSIPFVALIAIYEGLCRLLQPKSQLPLADTRAWPISTRKSSPVNTSTSQEPTLILASAPRERANGSETHQHGTSVNNTVYNQTDLIALIQKLSTQVEDLAGIVAAQKAGWCSSTMHAQGMKVFCLKA